MRKAINIQWDTDGDETLFKELPSEINIPDNISDDKIEDYISDTTGFCHKGFDIQSVNPAQCKG